MKYPTKNPIRIGNDYLPALLTIALTQKQQSDLWQASLEYLFLGKEPENLEPVTRGVWACLRWDLDYEQRRKEERMRRGK